MQCCLNCVTVNDVPEFLLKNPTVNDNAVIILSNSNDSLLRIALQLQGIISYFPVRAATLSEYDSDVIPKFHLTAEAPIWDPGSSPYSLQEDSMLNFRGKIVSTVTTSRGQITMQVNAVCSSLFTSDCVIDATDDNNFDIYLESFVQISLTSTSRRAAISHDELAKCRDIHPDHVKAMVQRTTQKGAQTKANPALSRQFWTNDCMLQYRCLSHPVFTDMMLSNMYLRRNNKCAQVFASGFGWVCVYLMKSKGEANKALSLMFQRQGMSPSIVMDRSKEQTLGKFHRKL